MNSIERIGLVGFGPMGQLVAEKMLPGKEIIACDPRIVTSPLENVTMTDIEDVAQSDAVIVAVPARHLEQAVSNVTREMPDSTLLVDISSVKIFPGHVFHRYWPVRHNPALLCHPLFGPQSAAESLHGLNVIVTEQSGDKAEELLRLWGSLGLNIARLSAEEHDKQMAEVHAKTFILGRLACAAGDTPVAFHPPSHEAVRMLEALDAAHSPELFEAIVDFNPYAKDIFGKMRAELDRLAQPNPEVTGIIERNSHISGILDERLTSVA